MVELKRGEKRRGTIDLSVDGVAVAHVEVPFYMGMMSSIGPSVGYDHGSAVSTRYQSPYAYTGVLHEIVIEASQRSRDAEARSEMSRQ
jgi:arylsulfatase